MEGEVQRELRLLQHARKEHTQYKPGLRQHADHRPDHP
jgi:hypothetical protein